MATLSEKIKMSDPRFKDLSYEERYNIAADTVYDSYLKGKETHVFKLPRNDFKELLFDFAFRAMEDLHKKRIPEASSLNHAAACGFTKSLKVLGMEAPEFTKYGKSIYLAVKGDLIKKNED